MSRAVSSGPSRHADWAEITLTSRCNQRRFFCYEHGRDVASEPDLDSIAARRISGFSSSSNRSAFGRRAGPALADSARIWATTHAGGVE